MSLWVEATAKFSVLGGTDTPYLQTWLFQPFIHDENKKIISIRCFSDSSKPLKLSNGSIFDIYMKVDDDDENKCKKNLQLIIDVIKQTIYEKSKSCMFNDWVQLEHSNNDSNSNEEEPISIELLRLILKKMKENKCSLCSSSLDDSDEYYFKSDDEIICMYWDMMGSSSSLISTYQIKDYEKGMIVNEIKPNIYHVEFNHQLLVGSTFLRFQERYESPNNQFKNHFIHLETYKEWERQNDKFLKNIEINHNDDDDNNEGFCYYTHWPGFNIPGEIIHAMLYDNSKVNINHQEDNSNKHPLLLPREQAFLNVLRKAGAYASFKPIEYNGKTIINDDDDKKFYVIGTCKESTSSCLAHELSHACYSLNKKYKFEINNILNEISNDIKNNFIKYLLSEGYCDDQNILLDEIHAYLLDSSTFGGSISHHQLIPYHNKICSIFLKYTGTLGSTLIYGVAPEDKDY